MKKIIASILVLSMILSGCAGHADFQPGIYAGSSTYASEEYNKTWNYQIEFRADGAFVLTDDAGEQKGSGTYKDHSMTYDDGRAAAFQVRKDGSLSMTTDLPYGKSAIITDKVGGIILTPVDAQSSATK